MQCRYDGHHKPAESGEPSEFDIAVETVAAPERRADAEQDQAHAVAGHVLGEFIRRLCADGDALTAGRRLMLLAYLAGQLECSTNRELARKLKVSPGRVSQLMAELPEDFASLMRLKRRAIKGRHPIERNNLE